MSYASEDKQLVAGIASELKAAFPFSLEVHRDEDFKLGDNWKEDIEDGLDKTDILLVIFTDRPKCWSRIASSHHKISVSPR